MAGLLWAKLVIETFPPSMLPDLESMLPALLPRAIEWVKAQSASIREQGSPLDDQGMRLARAVGVTHPDRIRVCVVQSIPLPEDPELRAVALENGVLGPEIAGITFGYGIYARDGAVTNRLISHECRHVYQYEKAGSIDAFLPVYLHQVATVGYQQAPFEIDARRHELDDV